jgi:hypothetical protein
MLEPPEHVLDPIRAPSEVCGVPAKEVRPPVRKQFRIIERAPAADNRIADKVGVDATRPRFRDQFVVGDTSDPPARRPGREQRAVRNEK